MIRAVLDANILVSALIRPDGIPGWILGVSQKGPYLGNTRGEGADTEECFGEGASLRAASSVSFAGSAGSPAIRASAEVLGQ